MKLVIGIARLVQEKHKEKGRNSMTSWFTSQNEVIMLSTSIAIGSGLALRAWRLVRQARANTLSEATSV